MNTLRMAKAYLSWAEGSLREAQESLARGDFPRTVRRAQECIELSAKSVLRALGIEFPREHDVSQCLSESGDSVPEWFAKSIPEVVDAMREITPKRGLAMYGLEREMTPPEELFGEADATRAVQQAARVFELCRRLIKEWERLE